MSGGDDVQQLCDAGEEEFLEIMALVGMASKPLHVRRLQKALQEWLSNPGEIYSVHVGIRLQYFMRTHTERNLQLKLEHLLKNLCTCVYLGVLSERIVWYA